MGMTEKAEVKVDKQQFDRLLRKMLATPPLPLEDLKKRKPKKKAR